VELAHERVDTDDGKDQPEDQTDQLELKMKDFHSFDLDESLMVLQYLANTKYPRGN